MATRTNLGTSTAFKADLGGTVNATDSIALVKGQLDYLTDVNIGVALADILIQGGFRCTNRLATILTGNVTGKCEVNGGGDLLNFSAVAGTWAKLIMRSANTRFVLINGTLTLLENIAGVFQAGDDLDVATCIVLGGQVYLLDSTQKTDAVQCYGGYTRISRDIGASGLVVAGSATVDVIEQTNTLTNDGLVTVEGGRLKWAGGDITGVLNARAGIIDFRELPRSITITGAGESCEGCTIYDPPQNITVTWTPGTTRGAGARHIPYPG